jgi:hypothetical protein
MQLYAALAKLGDTEETPSVAVVPLGKPLPGIDPDKMPF